MLCNKHLPAPIAPKKRAIFVRQAPSVSSIARERENLVQTTASLQSIANNAVRLVIEYPLWHLICVDFAGSHL